MSQKPHFPTTILNVYQVNHFIIAILMNQFSNNQLPMFLKNLFRTNAETHNYNTRSNKQLHKPRIKTNIKKSSISYKGVDVYNSLPSDFKQLQCKSTFKRKLKNFILNQST